MQGDAEKVRLRGAALTREEEVACAARWRADCERYAVERAGFWMSGASSALGASSGAAIADAAPAQQLAEVPGSSGYVSLGGVPVPSRGAQSGTLEARQFVRTAHSRAEPPGLRPCAVPEAATPLGWSSRCVDIHTCARTDLQQAVRSLERADSPLTHHASFSASWKSTSVSLHSACCSGSICNPPSTWRRVQQLTAP